MKNFIKNKLTEAFNLPSFRLPKTISLSDEEITALKSINWADINFEDLDGSDNVAHLVVKFPFETNASNGIIIDIQVVHDVVYQPHIHMSENLHSLGLGYKIYKALIKDLGHLYSGKGRRMNPYITKIWDKLKNDSEFDCYSNEVGDMCMIKNNPNKEFLINFMN